MRYVILVAMCVLAAVPLSLFAAQAAQVENGSCPVRGDDIGTDRAFQNRDTLIPCGNDIVRDTDTGAECPANPCRFQHLVLLINRLIDFLFLIAIPIAAIMFSVAGFMYVTAGGSTERASKGKTIFTNVAGGLILILVAWLIVELITSTLTDIDVPLL